MITPHIIWLSDHDYPTVFYFINRSSSGDTASWINHFTLPIGFFANFLTNLLPVIVAVLIGVGFSGFRAFSNALSRISKLAKDDVFIFSTLASILILCLLSALTAARLKVMWTMPIGYCCAGLFGIMLAQLDTIDTFRKRFLLSTLCLYTLLLAVMAGVFFISPYTLKTPHRLMYDGKSLAKQADTYWKQHEGNKPLTTVTGELWPAGNIAWYHEDRPSVFINGDWHRSPWIDPDTYQQQDQLYVSQRKINAHQMYIGLCATAVMQIDWPTAGSVNYENHPKVWFTILKPINKSSCLSTNDE